MPTSQSTGTLVRPIAITWCTIAVLISTRRLLFIVTNNGEVPRQVMTNIFNEGKFLDHSALTLAHVLSSSAFIILALIQFSSTIRRHHTGYHRGAGVVAIMAGMIAGATGIAMGFIMPSGGLMETSAMLLFGSIFLASLARGYQSAKRKQFGMHQNWMIRAFAIASAIVTIRLIVFFFFITRDITQLTFSEFFGLAQWLGFSIHLAAAEWWIRRRRKRSHNPVNPRLS